MTTIISEKGKMITPRELKLLFKKGENISSILKGKKFQLSDEQIIEVSYDLQAGSYIDSMKDEVIANHLAKKSAEIAKTIKSIMNPTSILEAGIGEATTFSGVFKGLKGNSLKGYGFDLSWSRVAYARKWLEKQSVPDVTLCSGSLMNIPFADNSIDVVYTSHAIEPNGGMEEIILKELYRVAKRLLILLEPAYEFANNEIKARMDMYGYCKNLSGKAEKLGYDVVEHKLFPIIRTLENPSAITVIKKRENTNLSDHIIACPKFKTPLQEIGGMLFSPEAQVVYPVLNGIPCLRVENGILASNYCEIFKSA